MVITKNYQNYSQFFGVHIAYVHKNSRTTIILYNNKNTIMTIIYLNIVMIRIFWMESRIFLKIKKSLKYYCEDKGAKVREKYSCSSIFMFPVCAYKQSQIEDI